jgi:hypothetical protein
VNQDILNNRDLDCARLRSFRILSLKQELGRKSRQAGGGASVGRFFPALTTLGTMATAMGYLVRLSLSAWRVTAQMGCSLNSPSLCSVQRSKEWLALRLVMARRLSPRGGRAR